LSGRTDGANNVALTVNAYYGTGAYRYVGTGTATLYNQQNGVHSWQTAASGTAGNAITFTQAMTLDASGRLQLGTTTAAGMLTVSAPASTTYGTFNAVSNGFGYLTLRNNGTDCGYIGPGALGSGNQLSLASAGSTPILFGTNGSERARITAAGEFVVGSTTSAYTSSGRGVIEVNGSSQSLYGFRTGGTARGYLLHDGTNLTISNDVSAAPLIFQTAASERARITSGGDFLVGETSTQYSSKILTNGGPISTRIANVDANYGDVFVAGYTANTSERNIIRSAVSSVAGSSGFQFMISDGAGSATVTESFRINRTSCTVVGSLSKGSGSFKIDHPLKPDTHHLVHSFIEGPQADLIYRGKATLINGKVTVNVDAAAGMTEGTFAVLCREVQCFTSNESDWDAVRGVVAGNILTIECQNPNSSATVSWMVIGERKDKHMYDTEWTDENGKVIVEPLKGV
jgi:hypothetical protein